MRKASTTTMATPELKNIRIKLHYQDDARFILLPPSASFEELVRKVGEKLHIPKEQSFKVKVRDEEGDLITMGDQDDWDMALSGTRKEFESENLRSGEESRGGEGGGRGKMEIWVT